MDFSLNTEQKEFIQEVRNFTKEYPPDSFPTQGGDEWQGIGSFSYEYARLLGSKGYLSLTWPKEYGGSGLPLIYDLLFKREMTRCKAPIASIQFNDFAASSIIAYGTERLKNEILPLLAKGEISMCQGFSETEAGSDLFALKTRAVEGDNDYIINGQKLWTSHAQLSHYGEIIVRTDPNVPKHMGLSAFIVDMKSPGITIRPILSMAGEYAQCEVFFDDVRVPKDYMVGDKNAGLQQVLIGFERDRYWGRCPISMHLEQALGELVDFVKRNEILANDVIVRQQLAELAIRIEICNLLTFNGIYRLDKKLPFTYEGAQLKIIADETCQRFADIGMRILGLYGQLKSDSKYSKLKGEMEKIYLIALSHTISGGTSEIMRDTIAKRGLGLPKG